LENFISIYPHETARSQKRDIDIYQLRQNPPRTDSIKYFDTMGIQALFSVAKGRDRLILLCFYDLGCRVGELVTTRVSDIDFQNGFIRIPEQQDEDRPFSGRPGQPGHYRGHQREHPARPGVAIPWQKQWPPEHQDGSEDHRPPGKGGRDPGGLPPKEALPQEGHSPYPQAQARVVSP
jgi:integrase